MLSPAALHHYFNLQEHIQRHNTWRTFASGMCCLWDRHGDLYSLYSGRQLWKHRS